jgi:hypothetical protein
MGHANSGSWLRGSSDRLLLWNRGDWLLGSTFYTPLEMFPFALS